ncbi:MULTISPECIES: hypothetical protein [unclassified Bartonella]|uniref:hypothetical protein n=1 Tax=unclassified Bartonella TaxID=2645622 RepID=UPI0035D0AC7C
MPDTPPRIRFGRLDLMEEPHLGLLMQKIVGKTKPAAERLMFSIEQDAFASSTPDSQQNNETQGGQE